MLRCNVSELKCYGVLPLVTCVLSAVPKNHCIDVSRPKFLFYLFSTCVCVCDVHEYIYACSYVSLWVYMHMWVHAYGGTKLMSDLFLNGSLLIEVSC